MTVHVLDLRKADPSQHTRAVQRRFLEIGAGESLQVWFAEEPRALRMACLENGMKYTIQQAEEGWLLRLTGIDFHPLGNGVGIHSVVGDEHGPLLAACDRRESFYLFDTATMSVAQQINVGGMPSHVALSPRGDLAMVANNEQGTVVSVRLHATREGLERRSVDPDRPQSAGQPGDPGIRSLPIGRGPHLPAFSADGRWVCAPGGLSGDAAIIDAVNERVLAVLPVGPRPHDPEFSADGQFAFVPVADSGDVAVIATGPEPRVVRRLPAGGGPSHLAVDGERLYVANSYSGDVTVIRLAGDLDRWDTEAVIPSGAGAHVPLLTPDGSRLLVANFLDDTVAIIDTVRGVRLAEVPVGYYPHSFGISPDGRFAVVACWGDPDVPVIDIAAARVVARVPGGMGASHVAFAPDGRRAFVGNSLSDSLTVVDLAGLTRAGTIAGGRPLQRKGADAGSY